MLTQACLLLLLLLCVCGVCPLLRVHARPQVTNREYMESIQEWFGCKMVVRGVHVDKGRRANPGEQKLFLLVEGPTQLSVDKACREVLRYIEEVALQVGFNERERSGKYSVV